MDSSTVKVGRIGYLNVLPIYYPLEQGTIKHGLSFVYGSPAELNELMACGKLDVSVVSSVEYARHSDRYRVLPDLSISCRGAVKSVLLFSKFPLDELDGRIVHLTPQSHTSVALLKLMLSRAYRIRCVFASMARPLWQTRHKEYPDAYLAIGDEALYWAKRGNFPYTWDLGDLWYKWTGLPFVFALWVCRKDLESEKVANSVESLLKAKAWGTKHLDLVCSQAARTTFLTKKELKLYFQHLIYDLGSDMLEALNRYYGLLYQEGMLDNLPSMTFPKGLPEKMPFSMERSQYESGRKAQT
ncbi:MAG: menaquinone biosynthesis protein [Thermodesulforhabdaceae bacterium]